MEFIFTAINPLGFQGPNLLIRKTKKARLTRNAGGKREYYEKAEAKEKRNARDTGKHDGCHQAIIFQWGLKESESVRAHKMLP